MLSVLQQFGDEGHLISLEEMGFDNKKWIDILDPTPDEIANLADKVSIPPLQLERCLDPHEAPGLMEIDNFLVIFYSCPLGKDGRTGFTRSFGLIVSEKLIITIRRHPIPDLPLLSENVREASLWLRKGTAYAVFMIFEKINKGFGRNLDDIDEKAESIEEQVMTKPDSSIVSQIFKLRKILIYYHTALTADLEVISAIVNGYSSHVPSDKMRFFQTIMGNLNQLIDKETTHRLILGESLQVYMSSVSNQLNVVMKRMTALASFILVPTLIAGIYGMNFEHMPELDWLYGYPMAIGIMVLSSLAVFWIFKSQGLLSDTIPSDKNQK